MTGMALYIIDYAAPSNALGGKAKVPYIDMIIIGSGTVVNDFRIEVSV